MALMISLPFPSKAGTDDSLCHDEDLDRLVKIDSITGKLSGQSKVLVAENIYSSELVIFENNQMPITEQDFMEQVRFLEFEIPMVYNEEVKRIINFFGTTWQTKFKDVLTYSQYYFPIYEEILDKNNLPIELKYLSVIESGLNPKAVSSAGATGLWQFMHSTGKFFDLEISHSVDERRSIEKSTEAACRYFKEMYAVYNDWFMVMAAYNFGPGNLNKAIRNSGGKRTFWEVYSFLPKQTQHYIPSFIAMAYLMNFYDFYGITPSLPGNFIPAQLTKVSCNSQCSFKALTMVLDISKDELLAFNPELKNGAFPKAEGAYMLYLPVPKAYEYIEKEEAIVEISKEHKDDVSVSKKEYHTVRRGESLGSISKKYHCGIKELKKWNNLRSNTLQPGQKLLIHK